MIKHVDTTFKSPNVLSFCSGGRMLEKGLERANYISIYPK
jgi:hypothetical protein